MSANSFESIQRSINERQKELHSAADILAKASRDISFRARLTKILLIFLGAFAATKGAADQVVGSSSTANVILYTIVGIAIATLAGLEAAFKFESHGAELNILATTCQSTIRQIDSQWQKEIGSVPLDERVAAARRLLDMQDIKLGEIQDKAARNGVNITLEIRELYQDNVPYAA